MDEIELSSGMPRTIYHDNDVSPIAHRMRALGGPLFSALGLVISLLVRAFAPRDSMAREVANWSSLGHGLILTGSLAPLPIVDGGSILKWTLVDRGRTQAEADQIIEQAGIATGRLLFICPTLGIHPTGGAVNMSLCPHGDGIPAWGRTSV